ncbi:MAG: LacI family DNA-binding transcriptional regulator [Hydrogenibacillus sp.]|nr:LacI family DNA-binding transcriptional regulator [Hydrogenibacillus sp.]
MTTRKDVAHLARVSEATVSRVFSDHPSVKPETKRRVLQAAQELGYAPHALARAVARKRSQNIGVVLPYLPDRPLFSYDYVADILNGIALTVRNRGYDLVLFQRPIHEHGTLQRFFDSKKIDGAIFLGLTQYDHQALLDLQSAEQYFVMIGYRSPELMHLAINADHFKGSFQAVAHLIAQGHRRIALINGERYYSDSTLREEGVRAACSAYDFMDCTVYHGSYDQRWGAEFVDIYLALSPRPTAVLAANDLIAFGFMQALKSRGIRPGLDVAIVGYDDSHIAELLDPPLSSVRVPHFEMGLRAAEELINNIERGTVGHAALPPVDVELVVRASSAYRFEQ